MLTASEYSNNGRLHQPATGPAELNLPRVLWILSSTLEKLVARNEKLVEELNQQLNKLSCDSVRLGKSLNAFHGVRAPGISIPKYLERIYKYTNCSPSCFVVGYVYIDMLTHKHPDSLVLSLNVHRLLVTSVMVASKMLDDERGEQRGIEQTRIRVTLSVGF
ncbi:variant 2, Cyclin-U1-1 [Lathyrus oleraceus]|uniref:Variant 2, Cyclin-U1-1 n=1 Tax=Pisum sativum TaxID=3888 RepID=A0A9D5AMH9_PEA|nr:variant 2, Cyclin-U1-1 [Pisum sativum]